MVSHRSLSDTKSPQVSTTFLSILADLNNVVVRMFSSRPFISKSSSPCMNPFVTVPRAPITIGIILTFMFLIFKDFLTRSWYLSFFSLCFNFTLWSAGTAMSTIRQVLFFLLIIMGLVVWLRLGDPFVYQNPYRSFCVSFSWTDSGFCIYHLFVWSNVNFLHNFHWINYYYYHYYYYY